MPDSTSYFTTGQSGLKLHARRWGPEVGRGLPLVCLPGLSRNTADFEDVAAVLAGRGRTVYAFDYRGRGLSDYDPDWKNYDVKIEIVDILDQLTALAITEAVFFGTSRGGIHAMLIAALRPLAIRGAILNDVGPVINGKGLARIKSYVGKMPQPRNFDEAASILKRVNDTQFPNLDEEGWRRYARRTWKDEDGRLVPAYDVNLLKSLEMVDLEAPLPELWPQFGALARVPLMVLRGAHSDILSAETADEMIRRHPDAKLVTIADEGHAPLIADDATQQAVLAFVEHCDVTPPRAPAPVVAAAPA